MGKQEEGDEQSDGCEGENNDCENDVVMWSKNRFQEARRSARDY